MELDGARTLVAGATGVLGGEISRGLARQGARLVLAGRDEKRLVELAGELGTARPNASTPASRRRSAASSTVPSTRSVGWIY